MPNAALVSPGATDTEGMGKGASPDTSADVIARYRAMAQPPEAVARAIAFAIEQPDEVDVGEIVVRSTAQA